jgi:hypothetical protein
LISLGKSLQEINEFLSIKKFACKIYKKNEKKEKNEKKKKEKKKDKKDENEKDEKEEDQNEENENENGELSDIEMLNSEEDQMDNENIEDEERKIGSPYDFTVKGDENQLLNLCYNLSELLDFGLEGKKEENFIRYGGITDKLYIEMMVKRISLFSSQYNSHKQRFIFYVLRKESSFQFKYVVDNLFRNVLNDSIYKNRIERYKNISKYHSKRLVLIIFAANYSIPQWDNQNRKWHFNLQNKKEKHALPLKNNLSELVLKDWAEIFEGVEEISPEEIFGILDLLIQEWLHIGRFLYPRIRSLYEHFFGSVLIPFIKLYGSLSKLKTSTFELTNKKQNEFIDNKTQRGNKEEAIVETVVSPYISILIQIILETSIKENSLKDEIHDVLYKFFGLNGNFETVKVKKRNNENITIEVDGNLYDEEDSSVFHEGMDPEIRELYDNAISKKNVITDKNLYLSTTQLLMI